jgi:N-acetylneuraminic acid mutarotase
MVSAASKKISTLRRTFATSLHALPKQKDRLIVCIIFLHLFTLERVAALTAGSAPIPRNAMGFAATADGMLYVFGGLDGRDRRNDLHRFSPDDNAWTALSASGSAPSPRNAMGFAATPGGMLYVFGGLDREGPRNDLYRFSPGDNAWTALSPSDSAPSQRNAMGFAATPDGMLYVFGGLDDGGPRNDLYRFSPGDNAWTALPPSGSAPSPRNAMGFAATPDGMLYIFGGLDGIGRRNDLHRFAAGDNAWTALSPSGSAPSSRSAMGFVATPDGMLYVFGGLDGSDAFSRFNASNGFYSLAWKASKWTQCDSSDQICCRVGTYRTSSDVTSCTVCPAGTYIGAPDASSCTACPAGTYNSFTGASSSAVCSACSPGTYSENAGSGAGE